MIKGVQIKPLQVFPDERGRVMEVLRDDDSIFEKFGQVYITTVYPEVVKAWHYHKVQSDNIAAVSGMVKLVLFDAREPSSTHGEINEFYIGLHNPLLIHIPPRVYHGFKCISTEEAILVNCPTEHYDAETPDEYRIDAHSPQIGYKWERRDQ